MSVERWHNETIGKKVVESLIKNKFDAVYFSSKEKAIEHVLSFISLGMKIGMGGSVTLNELNVLPRIEAQGGQILNHNLPNLTAEEKLAIRREQLVSDVFLSSTNALTLEGHLVNVDGTGNRVAAMTFGPKKVIIIAGINKIVTDINAALEKIKLEIAPKNNKRIGLANPCATTGVCMNCQGKTRICNIYSILKRKPTATDITVVIVGEKLGY